MGERAQWRWTWLGDERHKHDDLDGAATADFESIRVFQDDAQVRRPHGRMRRR